jgi:rubrerythrin
LIREKRKGGTVGLIDDAVALERRAEGNYRDAASRTSDTGAKRILEMLADEESRHAAVLRGMKGVASLKGPDLLAKARAWVRGTVEGGAKSISPDVGLLDVLRRAMEIEQTTEAFYRDHQNEAGEAQTRELFSTLADIERQHYLFVGSLVEYYDRPNEWIESAEFGLRPSY